MEISKETVATAKTGVWGAVAGAVLTMIVGFNWGNWHSGATVTSMVTQAREAGRVTAMANVCAATYAALPNATANLAELKKIDSYKRSDIIEKSGAATAPGATRADSTVARACADKLTAA